MKHFNLKAVCLLFLVSAYTAVAAFYPVNRGMVNQQTIVTNSTGTTTAIATGNQVYVFEGTQDQTLKLPNAQNLPIDWWYDFTNNSTGTVTVTDNGGNTIKTLLPGDPGHVQMSDRSTTNGIWKLRPTIATSNVWYKPDYISSYIGVPGAGLPVKTNFLGLLDFGLFSSSLPLTTKGDLLSFSTTADRFPVGGDGLCLITDSTQTFGIKWASCTSGATITMGAFGSSPNGNGATVSGSTLTLQPADATNPGGLSLGAQNLGSGTKTVDDLIDSGLTALQAVVTDGGKKLTSLAYSIVSAATSLVERDSNQNAFANAFIGKGTNVVSGGTTTTLTAASTLLQQLTGSSNQTFQLPDATTLAVGWGPYHFNNNSTGTLTVKDGGGSTLFTLPSGGDVFVWPVAVATTAGSWDYHFAMPSNASYGTAGMTITGTLNVTGTTTLDTALTGYLKAASGVVSAQAVPIPIADGGTNGTTANAGFNNLSPMTTLGDIIYENSTPAATRLAGNTTTTRQFLTQTGTGAVSAAPAWNTIATSDIVLPTTSSIATSNGLATIDWNVLVGQGGLYTSTLGANTTFTFANPRAGQVIVVVVKNNGSNYTAAFSDSRLKWSGGTTPTQTTGNKKDVFSFLYDGTDILGTPTQNF